MSDLRWRDKARCAGVPGGMTVMFPCDRAQPGSEDYWADVRALRESYCWRCPVRAECLADGLTEEAGLWGGLEQIERRKIVTLNCACGAPLDPKDLRVKLYSCRDCRPVLAAQSSLFRPALSAQ